MGDKLKGFFRGLFFIRFSVALWASLFAFIYLDGCTGAANITRAILTPETGWQASSAAFMVFCCGMVVLITVRVVALNGHERFDCEEEEKTWVGHILGDTALPVWFFLTAHLPGILMLVYLAWNIWREQVPGPLKLAGFLLAGVSIGYIFWLLVGFIYLWSFTENYKADRGGQTVFDGFGNKILIGDGNPRRVLFPNGWVFFPQSVIDDIKNSSPPRLIDWLNVLVFRPLANHNGTARKGYASPDNPNYLYEGHRLATISFLALIVLYVYLFAYTAPVVLPVLDAFCNLFTLLVLGMIFAGIAGPAASWKGPKAPQWVKGITCAFVLSGVIFILLKWSRGFFGIVRWVHDFHGPRTFSVFASVMVLVIGLLWLLIGIAFLADASRFPVLTGSLALLVLIKLLPTIVRPFQFLSAEHFFSAVQLHSPVSNVQKPSEILDARLDSQQNAGTGDYQPLIVVTAEGGGIHAAAWTAKVLAELERSFRMDNRSFHGNILLFSTVSGGSVGTLGFLREYTPAVPFSSPSDPALQSDAEKRVTLAASCSSLASAAWGLSYNDAINFLWPLGRLPYIGDAVATSTTDKDGHVTIVPPAGADRSWALERAFNRNLTDPDCDAGTPSVPGADQALDGYNMTLSWAVAQLNSKKLPAFTFNTTVVETGDRFLLANYDLPPGEKNTGTVPAPSFLDTFADDKSGLYADLPLAAAARMSASFTYVTSASRIPMFKWTEYGYHFVDGGYYDNPGTSSAIEFVHYAVEHSNHFQGAGQTATKSSRKLPILWIEILNGHDIDPSANSDSLATQQKPDGKKPNKLWGPINQLGAPPNAFLNAAQDSVVRRDRRELCMMEKAYQRQVTVHHMVFDYRDKTEKGINPLSWELTQNQKNNIDCAIDPSHRTFRCDPPQGDTVADLARKAAAWFAGPNSENVEECPVYGRDRPK